MDNTTFNLIKYFAGDYPGSSQNYNFVVGSHKPAERSCSRGLFKPKEYTYRGKNNNEGKPGFKDNRTILIEPYGDGQVYAYLLDDPNSPTKRRSYYELTHSPGVVGTNNMISDLPNYRVNNTDAIAHRTSSGVDLQYLLDLHQGLYQLE